jgi:predicted alpha-1,2-mannosidase
MIYLYDWAGEPRKAQKWVREVMDRLYNAMPDGYCGDEDNGQTSAWYIFSALGFYPVCPGSGEYAVGSPYFQEAVVHLENGKDLRITAKGNRADTPYISEMKVNGKPVKTNFLDHDDIAKGADLEFSMSQTPIVK